jgi:hypothetical protein
VKILAGFFGQTFFTEDEEFFQMLLIFRVESVECKFTDKIPVDWLFEPDLVDLPYQPACEDNPRGTIICCVFNGLTQVGFLESASDCLHLDQEFDLVIDLNR